MKRRRILEPHEEGAIIVDRLSEYKSYTQLLVTVASRARQVDSNLAIIFHTIAASIGRLISHKDESHIVQLAKICQAFAKKKHRQMREEDAKKIH